MPARALTLLLWLFVRVFCSLRVCLGSGRCLLYGVWPHAQRICLFPLAPRATQTIGLGSFVAGPGPRNAARPVLPRVHGAQGGPVHVGGQRRGQGHRGGAGLCRQ
jgi:hypothetical protein